MEAHDFFLTLLITLLTGTWFTRLLAAFNYSMAAMLLPERLADSFGMQRNALVRITFYAIVWITRVLVLLLPRRLRGVPAAASNSNLEKHFIL